MILNCGICISNGDPGNCSNSASAHQCISLFWSFNQNDVVWLLYIKKKGGRVSSGFTRIGRVPGRPAGSTGFRRANSQTGFYLHPDRFQARVGRVAGRPVGPIRVSKHWSLVTMFIFFALKGINVFILFLNMLEDCIDLNNLLIKKTK
jgi:hypothetical protein